MLGVISASSDVDVGMVLERLKSAIFRGRIRLREFFKDFDPLRSGKVTEAKFRTALDEAALKLSDSEFAALARAFADPTDPKRVMYEVFLSSLEVFNTPGMETSPTSFVEDFTPKLKRVEPTLSPAEEDACYEVLAKLSHICKVRGLLLRPFFADHYANVNSPILVDQVTHAQFRNAMSQLNLSLTAAEAELLNKKFAGTDPNYVNYVAFACAVDESERTFSTREPRSYVEQPLSSGFRAAPYHAGGRATYQPGRAPTNFNQPRHPVSYADPALGALMEKLQTKAMQHRMRASEFFRDYDKHRDQTITQAEFIKGLSIAYDKMGLGLSEAEIKLLLDAFGKKMRHGAVHVQWRAFVAEIEKVFQTSNMEKDPTSGPAWRTVEQQPKTLSPPAREYAVQKLLADLRQRVAVRRVLVKPLFADYGSPLSSTKTQDHVTRQNLVQSLSRFDIHLDEPEQQLLFDRYDTLDAGSVNMVALVRDIDAYEAFSARHNMRHVLPQDPDYGTVPTMSSGFWKDRIVPGPIVNVQPGRPPTSNDQPSLVAYSPASPALPALLAKLQKCSSEHRIRVDEAFKDHDRHRDGTITVPQFQGALALTFSRHLPLSQSDVELLVRSYAVDKSGQTHVLWKQFVSDVNRIFNIARLEKTPLVAAPPLPPHPARPKATLSAEEEYAVESILSRLRTHVSNRRVLVKPFFADAEYNRRSMRVVDHITKAQFGQCVNRLGLQLNNDELALLCRKFDDVGDGFVNYVTFATSIDTEEMASMREGAPRFPYATFKANGNFKATKTAVWQPGRAPMTGDVPSLLPGRPSEEQLGDLMRRLQEKVIQFKIPVQDFLVDYDKHKLGTVSVAQFRRGLNFAFGESYIKESITEEEMMILEQVYAREMLDGEYFVDWKAFCKDINAAILTPNLEVMPTMLPEPVVPTLGSAPVVLTAAEEARVQMLLKDMRERFRIRSVYVKAPFHDFARSNNSAMMVDRITRQQFVQGLSRLGIEPQASDLELLFKKYDDAGEGAVNYVTFTTDVDATETFSDRMRMPPSPVAQTTFYGGFRSPKVHEELLRSM